MLSFSQPTPLFRRTGLALAAAQLLVFAAGFPCFQMGVWLQTEPTLLAVFLFAGLTALWIAYGLRSGQLFVAAMQPLWLVPLLWVGWQLLVMPSAVSPWRSWFGPPQQGEGAGWWVAWLLCFMLMHCLWRVARARAWLLALAGSVVLGLGVMHWATAVPPKTPISVWQPAAWADYLAFMTAYVWLAVMAGGFLKKPQAFLSFTAACVLALELSGNRSGMVVLLPPMALTLLLEYAPRLRARLTVDGLWRKLCLAACLAPLLWVGFCYGFPEDLKSSSQHTGIVSMLADQNYSMGGRVMLNKVALQAAIHEPSYLTLGRGWGSFSDSMFRNALLSHVSTFDGLAQKNSWWLVSSIAFHTHNEALEALLDLGLIGMLLWLALPLVILRALPASVFWRTAPMLIGVTALSYLWFQLPQAIAFGALAWAALCAACTPALAPGRQTSLITLAMLLVAAVMGWSVREQLIAMREASALYDALSKDTPYQDFPQTLLEGDIKRGGDRLLAAVEGYGSDMASRMVTDTPREGASFWRELQAAGADYADTLSGRFEKKPVSPNEAGWLEKLLAATDATVAQTGPAFSRAAYDALWLRLRILADIDGEALSGLRHHATATLENAVLETLKRAPRRDDMATLFLLNLADFTGGDAQKQIDILQRLLAIAPNHRGALWVMGKLLAGDAQTHEAGIEMQKHALALGAARIYPISDEEIAALGRYSQ